MKCPHCNKTNQVCPGADDEGESCSMTRAEWCEVNPDLAPYVKSQWTFEEGNPNLHKTLGGGL